jgi:hypothetical protein
MSYQDFSLVRVQADFGITILDRSALFASVPAVPLSQPLSQTLTMYAPIAYGNITEKARSEWLVAPLLGDVWLRSNGEISVLSGVPFNVDEAAGLRGVCDFILSRSQQMFTVSAPVLVAIEAKRDSIPDGLGQCAAAMVAAQRFNQQAKQPIDTVYGCITTGSIWRFARLRGLQLDIDLTEYSISQPDRILGVLLHCCGIAVPT